jgi:hypothetical protein
VSKLAFHGRPFVIFDPANKEHRAEYYKFVKTGMWGHCPYRFVITDDQGDVVTMIQRKLIAYYVSKEFDTKSIKK